MFMVMPRVARVDGAGVLGADLLSHFDVDFDFGANKLNLFQPSSCGDRAVYWSDTYAHFPFVFRNNLGGTNSKILISPAAKVITVGARQLPSIDSKQFIVPA